MSLNVFYTYPIKISFTQNDERLLGSHYSVTSHYFKQDRKTLPLSFVKQLFSIVLNVFKTDVYVSFFGGYSSFLPSVMAKLTGKPHIIILGGSDCSNFPSIGYGAYQNKLLKWFTSKSLEWASHLAPVAERLVDTEYTYVDTDFPRQGYKNFCKSRAPFTVVNIGYDPGKFYKSKEKVPNSFLTVSQVNKANYYRKGIDLIFAMAEKFPDCTFTIVGNTGEMVYEHVPENLQLISFVPYDQLRDIYSAHEFYLQLSIMEGFPSALCEAMLCECIPIVSNVGAMPEIIGDTGFLFIKKDVKVLEKLINTALATDKLNKGAKARERIIQHFPLSVRNRLIELINNSVRK